MPVCLHCCELVENEEKCIFCQYLRSSRFGVMDCPENRVFDIKRGYDFLVIKTLSRLSIFRSVGKAGGAS